MKKTELGVFLAAGIAALLFTGCTSENELLQQRSAQAVRHYERSQYKVVPERELTLQDCIRLTLANTLDRKVGEFYLTVTDPDDNRNVLRKLPGIQHKYGMDPEKIPPHLRQMMIPTTMDRVLFLMDVCNIYIADRGKHPDVKWSVEQAANRMLEKLYQAMMKEALKIENTHAFGRDGESFSSLDLGLTFGFMDLGLSYFNYRQNRSQEWVWKQTSLRMAQNLSLDVTKAYVDYLTAQRSAEMIHGFLKSIPDPVWKNVRQARGIAPYKAFGLLREFNDMERQLQLYINARINARARLNSLMGYHPASEVKLNSPVLEQVPELTVLAGKNRKISFSAAPASPSAQKKVEKEEALALPTLEMMEKIALLNRPELARNDGKEGISAVECIKVIPAIFPQLRLFLHYNGHDEDSLYNRSWLDLGLGASFNLLNIASKGAEFHARYKAWKADEVATYASSIAVISQVRLSYNALLKSAELLKSSDAENEFQTANAKLIRSKGRKLNALEETELQLQGLKSRLHRLQRVRDFYLSAGWLINAMGLDNLDVDNLQACQQIIRKAEDAAVKAMDR